MWINSNFLLLEDLSVGDEGDLNVSFLSLRSSQPLVIQSDPQCNICIYTDDMDLAGDIIQAMASYLNVDDLQVSQ